MERWKLHGKILVAYYSQSGNTKRIAKLIQQETSGALYEIVPEKLYKSLYLGGGNRIKHERENGILPELCTPLPEIEPYEIIFLGTPNWGNSLSHPVMSFLNHYDFAGKWIIPFCTHGGGGAGHIPADLLDIYQGLAKGGVGLIITSFTSVAPVDHFNDGLLRLHDDSLIPEYRHLTESVHNYGTAIMPQLALGIYQRQNADGRYTQIPVNRMTMEDIDEVIRKFVSAAGRAKQAGFDGVQLHGCHGFILSEFLKSFSNHRSDGYGGSVEKRTKIVLDIIQKIKETIGDIHVSIKISAGDMQPEMMLEMCKSLTEAGLNSIEYEGYYSNFVPVLKKATGIPVILTGGHRKFEQINLLLNQYEVDYIGMCRPLIREENLPNRWKNGDTRPAACVSCGMCMSTYGYRCALTPQKYGKKPRKNR